MLSFLTELIHSALNRWRSFSPEVQGFIIWGAGAAGTLFLLFSRKLILLGSIKKRLKSLNGLTEAEIEDYSRHFIRSKIRISQTENGQTKSMVTDGIRYFRNKVFPFHDTKRFYIILAESGMGKSTFLINLMIKSVPLIELKRRYWFRSRAHIAICNADDKDLFSEIDRLKKLPNAEDVVLLIDSLDEDELAQANPEQRIDEIVERTHKFKKIIFCCRTQFFPSEKDEPSVLKIKSFSGNLYIFHKIYLEPFSEKNIRKYLNKKFPIWKVWKPGTILRKLVAFRIVHGLNELSSRPFILNYIDDILPRGNELLDLYIWVSGLFPKPIATFFRLAIFAFRVGVRKSPKEMIARKPDMSQHFLSSRLNLYRLIIDRWLDRETRAITNTSIKSQMKNDLLLLSFYTASQMIKEGRSEQLAIERDTLFNKIDNTGLTLSKSKALGRSLLSRNRQGEIVFAHRSIAEFFLAILTIDNKGLQAKYLNQPGWDNYSVFYRRLKMIRELIPFFNDPAHRNAFKINFDPEFRSYRYVHEWENDRPLGIGEILHIQYFRIWENIGPVDFNIFTIFKNFSFETYLNILDYMVFTLEYAESEIKEILQYIDEHFKSTSPAYLSHALHFARIYDHYGHTQLAIETAIQFFGQDPANLPYTRDMDSLIGFYRSAGDHDRYMVLRRKQFEARWQPGESRHFYEFQKELADSGRYDECIQLYQRFANNGETDLHHEGKIDETAVECYLATGDIVTAKEILMNRLRADPGHECRAIMVRLLIDEGKTEEALDLFCQKEVLANWNYGCNSCFQEFVTHGKLHVLQAKLADYDIVVPNCDYQCEIVIDWLKGENRLQEAIDFAENYIGKNPFGERIYNRLGLLHSAAGQRDTAFAYHEKTVHLLEEREKSKYRNVLSATTYYRNYGLMLYERGHYEQAIPQFEMARQRYIEDRKGQGLSTPTDVDELLGDCYHELQQYPSAFQSYSAALIRDSSDEMIEKVLTAGTKANIEDILTACLEEVRKASICYSVKYYALQNKIRKYFSVVHNIPSAEALSNGNEDTDMSFGKAVNIYRELISA